jgi:dsDNA-specific endonuclease/ATPase MutS2
VNFDPNTLVSLLFIAGGGGVVASIMSVVKTLRSGKIENEETLIKRLDADNKKQQKLRESAESRADQADKEAEEYRKQRNHAREQLARVRWYVMQKYGDDLNQFEVNND